MAKTQESVRLSPELWAQVDDLINYFGDTQSEVIAYVLRSWLSEHQTEIGDTKNRIDQLMKRRNEKQAGKKQHG